MTGAYHLWLEPVGDGVDLDEGIRSRVADPVWFLARQWELGEHQGEDASSPVAVTMDVRHLPLAYAGGGPAKDPTVVPAEALVEAEPDDWWTMGRRIRLGQAAAPLLAGLGLMLEVRLSLNFAVLEPPYQAFTGQPDGREVFRQNVLPGNAIWAEVPAAATDNWHSDLLCFEGTFQVGATELSVRDHDGGDVDWFTVDGPGAGPAPAVPVDPAAPPPAPVPRTVIPGRLTYPGAPNPRWWQIEDGQFDVAWFSPDRSHLGTMLLYDVVQAHADDWFWFPVPPPLPPADGADPPPSSGVVVTLGDVTVTDDFDQVWPLAAPPVTGPGAWSLFHTTGLDPAALVVWPVALSPQAGPLLDDVHLGIDDAANLAWAVEIMADGRHLLEDAKTDQAVHETTRTGTRAFSYQPSTTLPDHWHPYLRTDGGGAFGPWQQALIADLNAPTPTPEARKGPISTLIGGPPGPTGFGQGQLIEAHAIPSTGARLQRRYLLARDTNGQPVLWVERSARPLLGPPASHLRFDIMVEGEAQI